MRPTAPNGVPPLGEVRRGPQNMKELKFNNGGQPIYLDDIQTLQDLSDTLAEVFFLPQPTWRRHPIQPNRIILADGMLYVHGKIVKYTAPEYMEHAAYQSAYLNLYHSEGGQRVLANGATANCTESWSATISDTADPNATEVYSANDVPTLTGALQTLIRNTVNN